MKTLRFKTAPSAILAILFVSLTAHAVEKPANEVAGDARLFKSADGSTMPYRIFTPKMMENGKTYPLVLCFPGAKGRGTDNQARGSLAYPVLSSAEMQRKHPAFIFAPQCPLGGNRWVNHNWSDGAYDSTKVARDAQTSSPRRCRLPEGAIRRWRNNGRNSPSGPSQA